MRSWRKFAHLRTPTSSLQPDVEYFLQKKINASTSAPSDIDFTEVEEGDSDIDANDRQIRSIREVAAINRPPPAVMVELPHSKNGGSATTASIVITQ